MAQANRYSIKMNNYNVAIDAEIDSLCKIYETLNVKPNDIGTFDNNMVIGDALTYNTIILTKQIEDLMKKKIEKNNKIAANIRQKAVDLDTEEALEKEKQAEENI